MCAFLYVFPTRRISTEPRRRHRKKALFFCLGVGIRFSTETAKQKKTHLMDAIQTPESTNISTVGDTNDANLEQHSRLAECPKCGHKVSPASSRCVYCGERLTPVAPPAQQSVHYSPTTTSTKRENQNMTAPQPSMIHQLYEEPEPSQKKNLWPRRGIAFGLCFVASFLWLIYLGYLWEGLEINFGDGLIGLIIQIIVCNRIWRYVVARDKSKKYIALSIILGPAIGVLVSVFVDFTWTYIAFKNKCPELTIESFIYLKEQCPNITSIDLQFLKSQYPDLNVKDYVDFIHLSQER